MVASVDVIKVDNIKVDKMSATSSIHSTKMVHHVKHQHTKEELWSNVVEREMAQGGTVQMSELDSPSHTSYSRVIGEHQKVTVMDVIKCIVDEVWTKVAKDILEKKATIQKDSYPPAEQLLSLGSVWLLNETAYTNGKTADAHRLTSDDATMIPDWNNFTLRVHFVPDRFHVAAEYDWAKPCKGLLIDHRVTVQIGDKVPLVPVALGLPDLKDGVIVYEDPTLGFTVLDKPGSMPVHATLSNHAEDVVSTYKHALKERHEKDPKHYNNSDKIYAAVPQRPGCYLDMEDYGLMAIATKVEFAIYMQNMIPDHGDAPENPNSDHLFKKKFRCLVCIKKAEDIDRLEKFQEKKTLITHYINPKAPVGKRFVRHKPKNDVDNNWHECKMRILQIGDDKFRAACVQSVYKDSVDSCLAHRLWGINSTTPAEDLGVKYVMEIVVETITNRKHQIRGQLAAIGCPIVGDYMGGGGQCDAHGHHHSWLRLALQCCELTFPEPEWHKKNNKKKELIPTDKICTFKINDAWWSDYLKQYELYHQSY